jgi:hypothetical protein
MSRQNKIPDLEKIELIKPIKGDMFYILIDNVPGEILSHCSRCGKPMKSDDEQIVIYHFKEERCYVYCNSHFVFK